jgi:hypothetical protein
MIALKKSQQCMRLNLARVLVAGLAANNLQVQQPHQTAGKGGYVTSSARAAFRKSSTPNNTHQTHLSTEIHSVLLHSTHLLNDCQRCIPEIRHAQKE